MQFIGSTKMAFHVLQLMTLARFIREVGRGWGRIARAIRAGWVMTRSK